jgi:hypothetical protein
MPEPGGIAPPARLFTLFDNSVPACRITLEGAAGAVPGCFRRKYLYSQSFFSSR